MMDKKMPSVMQKNFAALGAPKPSRSTFDLSHDTKFDFNPGELIPVLTEMMIPGDTFRGKVQAFIRLATQAFPTMDNARVILEAFFTPYRLVWENFQRAMGERFPDPESSIDYVFPSFVNLVDDVATPFQFPLHGLGDYFGYPVLVSILPGDNDDYPSSPISLHARTYYKNWNDWYRSDSLQDRLVIPLGDGPDQYDHYQIQRRGKHHDYFTSALPWPQRGDAIPLPLGISAPVVGNGLSLGLETEYDLEPDYFGASTNTTNSGYIVGSGPSYGASITDGATGTDLVPVGRNVGVTRDPNNSGLIALLSNAAGATINVLRDYVTAQHMLETTARAGSLYRDQVKVIFGVTIPDFRLQRSEYVGGSRAVIGIHSVAQTSPTSGDSPQAGLAAYGTGFGELSWSYSAVEHGTLMILMSVTTDITYQNQLRRQYSIRSQYDIFRPEMAHLGEMPIRNQEMYFTGIPGLNTEDQGTWGYQEIWADYRSIPSRVGGSFRSIAPQSLDPWHWALDYPSRPELGDVFIVDDPPMARSSAVQDAPLLLAWVNHSIHAARPIPVHSIPGLRRL